MQHRGQEIGFAPIYSEKSRALILGSYPSPKSFDAQFYYGHPQNRFWPLIAALTGSAVPETIEEKKRCIVNHGLALWDSLKQCRITGASDLSITDPVPNDIAALIQKTGIKAVFCNGAASHKFYKKFNEAKTGVQAVQLPSTSPANAAYSFGRLLSAWDVLRPFLSS